MILLVTGFIFLDNLLELYSFAVRPEQQFRKLNEVASRKNINVVRNAKTVNMSVYDLLVGDVVHVETG